ncbi:MAG: polysaccharide biosynthesis/export family protein [Oculatellaceae cyanobacterium bins.114]|nr:polysaccharide biosynthesis/export family protein [Oculatellaceae cyanobacterium bins.114]
MTTASDSRRPEYILGPGDQLDITVFDYAEFTGAKVILPDGTITLPMIGRVEASGLTSDQLAQELTTQLNVFLVNPVVTVGLSVLRPVSVTVAGEVQRPGPLQLRSLTTTNLTIGGNTIEGTPTVSAALIEAGGITRQADVRQIALRRYSPDGNSQPVIINFWDAINSENATQDLILQDGDSIYVPRLDPNTTLDRRLIARASFAPDTVRVRVVGEVNNPGEVQVPPDSSLSSAVAIAGGPTEDARLSRVAFVRMNESGQIEQQRVDLRTLTDNYQVQEGDVIIVPKSDTSAFLDRAVQVLNPLNILLNLLP